MAEKALSKLQAMRTHVQVALARFLKMKEETLANAEKHLKELEHREEGYRAHASSLAKVVSAAIESGETDSEAYERDSEDYQRTLVAMVKNIQEQQMMREVIAMGMLGDDKELYAGAPKELP